MKKINFYHLRTKAFEKEINGSMVKEGGHPYATVAIEFNGDGTVNRGISICSPHDQFVKRVGTQKALGRLMSAKKKNENIMEIESFSKNQKRIMKKYGVNEVMFPNTNFKYLGMVNDIPTLDEKILFAEELSS